MPLCASRAYSEWLECEEPIGDCALAVRSPSRSSTAEPLVVLALLGLDREP